MSSDKRHIFLIGMMGCGKSTVGKILAETLKYKFIDLDSEIVKVSGKSIEKIFQEEGQEPFRVWETKVAQELSMSDASVIATGGGFPLKEVNWQWMDKNGVSVWLKASPEHILERIKDEDRPLLPKPIEVAHIEKILDARLGIYEKAMIEISTENKNPEYIAGEIISKLP